MHLTDLILPSKGFYCVVEQVFTQDGKALMKHHWLESVSGVQKKFQAVNGKGSTVFVAQATFSELGTEWKGRKRDNAAYLRNFFS